VNYSERISLNRLQKVLNKICFSAKTESAVELALYFSLTTSSYEYISIVEDMIMYLHTILQSALALFRIVEGELDKFKIDPQTGEVSTIQVSLSQACAMCTFNYI
jgi:hypothetical protein